MVQKNIKIYNDSFIVINDGSLNNILNNDVLNYKTSIFIDYISTIKEGLNLSPMSILSLLVDNGGGKSNISEMMSIEYYIRSFGAKKILFEMEIDYKIDYKMVDYVCNIKNFRIGVSVTRAMGYPKPTNFTYHQALRLLHKKLYGLIIARNAVCKNHSFKKSVLHVWCQSLRISKLIKKAYSSFNINDYGLDIKGIVILHLSVCSDSYIYTNKFDLT